MADILIIVGHSQRDTFCEALGKAYQQGAQSNGHKTQLFVLSRMQFDPILRGGYRAEQLLEPDLQASRAALGACDHLVIIFPLWCGDMPAILKGYFERVLQPDLLAAHRAGSHSMKIFRNKSARVIMTMGMPGLFYRLYFGAHALKLLRRNILHMVGIKPVRSLIFGLIGNVSAKEREAWLGEVAALGRAAN